MLFYHIGHEPVFAYICVPQKDIFELLDSDGNICAGRNRLPGRSWAGIRKRREKGREKGRERCGCPDSITLPSSKKWLSAGT